MSDTTIKKVEAASSPTVEMGQYLVAGKRVSMRLWVLEPGRELKHPTSRDYETVGYVISGRATLDLGQVRELLDILTECFSFEVGFAIPMWASYS